MDLRRWSKAAPITFLAIVGACRTTAGTEGSEVTSARPQPPPLPTEGPTLPAPTPAKGPGDPDHVGDSPRTGVFVCGRMNLSLPVERTSTTCAPHEEPVLPWPVPLHGGTLECQVNEDCTAHPGGYCDWVNCLRDGEIVSCCGSTCAYEPGCHDDTDCAEGHACHCDTHTCVPARCRTDDDCGAGAFCTFFSDYWMQRTSPVTSADGYYCTTPLDSCHTAFDCGTGQPCLHTDTACFLDDAGAEEGGIVDAGPMQGGSFHCLTEFLP